MKDPNSTFLLRNGVEIPCVGYGTWQTPDGAVAEKSVKEAIHLGYRHIDTAAAYANEESVGKGIAASGVLREKLFVTSKVWNSDRGYESTKKAFEKTLHDLNATYLDLYLIHWPASVHQFENWEQINVDTWRAMMELYQQGKIKAIGVSNFMPHHLEALMKMEIKPMVNQIEMHPGMLQEETRAYCAQHDIVVEAWSPLGSGKLFDNEILQKIAEKYEKSVAQICIRWCLQHEAVPLSKSVTPSRIKENLEIFDFEIQPEDMAAIDQLPNIGYSGSHPDKVDF